MGIEGTARRAMALLALLALLAGADAIAGQQGMDVALCVGAGNYQHFPPLDSPHRDALEFSRELDRMGDFRRIVVLSDLSPEGEPNQIRFLPTRKNIVDMLTLLVRSAPPNAGVIVYLRGYAEMKDGQAQYLPVDDRPGDGIPIGEIIDILDSGNRVSRKIVLLDAANPDPAGAAPDGDVSAADAVVVYSHEDGQTSLTDGNADQSLFSRAIVDQFLELDGETSLSADELLSHVNRYMSEYCLDNYIEAGQSAVMRGSNGGLTILNARPRTAGRRSAVLAAPAASSAPSGRPAAAQAQAAAPAAAPPAPPSRAPAPAAPKTPAPEGMAAISPKAENLRGAALERFRAGEYDKALNLFMDAAGEGDPVSEGCIGDLRFEGLGAENDFANALERYRRAADAGYADARDRLGFMIEHGIGCPADPALAAEWYAKAHAQGCAPAAYHLARLYALGQGVEKDAGAAEDLLDAIRGDGIEKLFLEDAERGFARAQYELGRLHREGVAVEKDMRQAMEWYKKVASHARANASAREVGDIMYAMEPSDAETQEIIIENYWTAARPVLGLDAQ